jgi:diguanylate cyclase (GGDEF)-like protein
MSISRRLWLKTFATLLVLAGVFALLHAAIRQSDAATQSRHETTRRITRIRSILSDLTDAETGQRGYVLTGRDSYLQPFLVASRTLPGRIARLKAQSADDPSFRQDIERLSAIAAAKLVELREAIAARRAGGLAAALRIIETGRGEALMEQARALAGAMEATLHVEAERRDQDMQRAYSRLLAMLALGGITIAFTSIFVDRWVVWSIARQQEPLLKGVRRIAGGDLATDIATSDAGEFGQLAAAFNDMMADLRAERRRREAAESALASSNAALKTHADGLTRRNHAADMLSRLAARLTGCADEAELANVIGQFAPLIVPSGAGALYTRGRSDESLRKVTEWSEPASAPAEIQPWECRGVRAGRPHVIHWPEADTTCDHVDRSAGCACRCLPIMAQGETVGLLYLEERDMTLALPLEDVSVLAESVGTTLASLRTRQNLRDLSIRDALTGLFNRRHLDETLSLELARAARSASPLSVVILDLDNFKRFNDTFGHDAGDMVLRALADAITGSIRQGDVACRYGGEEFMLVLPGAGAHQGSLLAERVRAAVEGLRLDYAGEAIGGFSASLGVATFPDCGDSAETLILAADRALYAAKAGGKNRVTFAALAA